ncbi:MAG: hypothetical protein ACOZBW_06605 [Thermodesulfobacteriota bacterium]
MSDNTHDYTHFELNREITAIGGHYTVKREVRLPLNGREVLYLVAEALFDTTCCGFGGLAYVSVQGFIEQWRYRTDGAGHAVTEVRPVTSEKDRADIRRIIEQREKVSQVNFL